MLPADGVARSHKNIRCWEYQKMEEGDMMLDAFCLERSLPIPNLTLLAWCEVSRNNIRVGGALSRLFSCILTTYGAT